MNRFMIQVKNHSNRGPSLRQDYTISILLATYNAENYICCLLDSIIRQTDKSWLLIVSDDGSGDSTPEILENYKEKYPGKFEILQNHESFRNARDNFFYLMKHAKSRYIMFCDHDDVWNEDKIAVTLDRMQELEKIEGADKPLLVHTDLEVVNSEMNRISGSFVRYSKIDVNRTALCKLAIQNVVTGCTAMMNEPLLKLAQKRRKQTGCIDA